MFTVSDPRRNDRLHNAADELLKACQLVLAIHNHPECQPPQHRINLDPKSLEQIRAAIRAATQPR